MSRSISTRSSGGSRKASSASVSVSGVRRSASCQSWATTSGARCSERQVRVAQPEHVELDRVDAGLDRGVEALERVAGGDQVGALVADQPQTLRRQLGARVQVIGPALSPRPRSAPLGEDRVDPAPRLV